MSDPVWIEKSAILLLHAEALAEHGGAEGLRDDGLLESAMARPRNLLAYEGITDLCRLSAAYAVGISRNHPFVDGNKRVAFISLALFLRLNGRRLAAEQVEAVRIMLALAEGMLTEGELTEWIKRHVVHAT